MLRKDILRLKEAICDRDRIIREILELIKAKNQDQCLLHEDIPTLEPEQESELSFLRIELNKKLEPDVREALEKEVKKIISRIK